MVYQSIRVSPLLKFAQRLAVAMRSRSAPAHRVEDNLHDFAEATDLKVLFHVLPGAVLASHRWTEVLEVAPGPPDLAGLDALESCSQAVVLGQISPLEGLRQIEKLDARGPYYGQGLTLLGFAAASATAVSFFGGGLLEMIASGAIGTLCGLLISWRLAEVLVTCVGTFGLAIAAHYVPIAGDVALVTGIIVLLPGFALTTALTELATRHLISGTSGVAAATLTLLQLGFGVALGSRLAELVVGPVVWSTEPVLLPGWVEPVALVGAALSFGILLQARARHLPHVLGACGVALYATHAATPILGPELAGGAGAFGVTICANAASRGFNQPAAVWQVPGILLLVPGSVGFRSVTALLQHDVLGGVEAAFSTLLGAIALVGGSLAGAALVRPRSR